MERIYNVTLEQISAIILGSVAVGAGLGRFFAFLIDILFKGQSMGQSHYTTIINNYSQMVTTMSNRIAELEERVQKLEEENAQLHCQVRELTVQNTRLMRMLEKSGIEI